MVFSVACVNVYRCYIQQMGFQVEFWSQRDQIIATLVVYFHLTRRSTHTTQLVIKAEQLVAVVVGARGQNSLLAFNPISVGVN